MRHHLAILATMLLASHDAHAWQAHLGGGFGEDLGTLVTFGARREVIVAGETQVSGDCPTLTVARFDRRGERRWEMRFPRDCFRPNQLLVDDADDVLVQGTEWRDESSTADGVIVKVGGDDGDTRWTYTHDLPGNEYRAGITIDAIEASGDVVAIASVLVTDPGSVDPLLEYSRLVIDGDTGAELSRTPIPPPPSVREVLDLGEGVFQRRASGGSVLWERTIAGFATPGSFVRAIQIDAAGDVYLGGTLVVDTETVDRDFVIVKLDGDTGDELWRRTLGDGASVRFGVARGIAFDARGNVYATGGIAVRSTDGTLTRPRFAVVRLRPDTGVVRWVTFVKGGSGLGNAVAVDRRGNVAAVGSATPPSGEDSGFAVVGLPGRTGRNGGVPRAYDPPE